jgi:hypothetical protein
MTTTSARRLASLNIDSNRILFYIQWQRGGPNALKMPDS